jgi:hypothetical protein
MAKYTSMTIDPPKRKKLSDAVKSEGGSAAVIVRDKKGTLTTLKKDDFAGVNQETLADDKARMKGNSEFSGGPAPRVGGAAPKSTGMDTGTAKRKMIKDSIRRVKKSDASPQAKRSAYNAYKR